MAEINDTTKEVLDRLVEKYDKDDKEFNDIYLDLRHEIEWGLDDIEGRAYEDGYEEGYDKGRSEREDDFYLNWDIQDFLRSMRPYFEEFFRGEIKPENNGAYRIWRDQIVGNY